jgi:FtsH-binding integral membrane protein
MGRTARLVLGVPRYALVAAVAAAVALTLFVTSLNVTLVSDLVIGGQLPLEDRLVILTELYPFVGTSFDTPQGLLLIVVALVTGVDVSMAVYHFTEHGVSVREGGSSAVGVVLGTLGAGCAACGSAILVGVLSLFGVSTALLWLPLDGLEFALGALVVLVLSIHWLSDGMRGGQIRGCPVDP